MQLYLLENAAFVFFFLSRFWRRPLMVHNNYGLFMASYRSLIAHSLHNLRLECATKHTECSLAGLGMNYCSHKEPSITFRDKPSVSCELRFTERHVTWVGWYAWYIVMKRHLLALPDHNDFFYQMFKVKRGKKSSFTLIFIDITRIISSALCSPTP